MSSYYLKLSMASKSLPSGSSAQWMNIMFLSSATHFKIIIITMNSYFKKCPPNSESLYDKAFFISMLIPNCLAKFLAPGLHWVDELITLQGIIPWSKVSSLMGMTSSTSNVIMNVFLYLGVFLSMIRWNGLNYSEGNITWIFSIWRLAENFSLE